MTRVALDLSAAKQVVDDRLCVLTARLIDYSTEPALDNAAIAG